MSREVVEEDLLILQENFFDLLLELGVLSSWSPPTNFIRPPATRNMKFPFLWEILLPLHWVFLRRFPMRPSFPAPQCLQPLCHPSKFPPRTERIQGTIQEICDISQIGIAFHGICPPIFIQTWFITIRQRCLLLLCALLSQQPHLFLICVVLTYTMIPGKIFTGLAKFKGIVSVSDFGFPI